jgi:hypothetical protein
LGLEPRALHMLGKMLYHWAISLAVTFSPCFSSEVEWEHHGLHLVRNNLRKIGIRSGIISFIKAPFFSHSHSLLFV